MPAPVASGWSGCRVGLAPTGKRRLVTAHTQIRHLSGDALVVVRGLDAEPLTRSALLSCLRFALPASQRRRTVTGRTLPLDLDPANGGNRREAPAADNRLAVEAQIRSLLSNPLRLGMQPSLTLYWL